MRRQTLRGRRLCDYCKEKAAVKWSGQGWKVEATYGCAEHEGKAKDELRKKLK